jgi:hypothetical protein
MPRVYNKHHNDAPPDAVYIMRPSRWGNHYVIGRDGTRAEVIAKHKADITPAMRDAIKRELKGKDLVCCCAPLACHGDTYIEIANE